MKEIQLTQGQVALVDDADYEWLNQWKWYAHKNKVGNSFYAIRNEYANGKQTGIKMHRFILGVTDTDVFCDHADLDGLNNQRYNLRKCSRIENGRNRPQRKGATSTYKGVSFKAAHKKWVAQIRPEGKPVHIGYFEREVDAAVAYNNAAKKHYGEFALLNNVSHE